MFKNISKARSNYLSPPKSIEFNPLLRNLSQSDKPIETLLFYQRIRHEGGRLNQFSFPPILKAASKLSALLEGMEIHSLALKISTLSDPYVQTALLDMYASCGEIKYARKVFDEMSRKDIITWNNIIKGYCRFGLVDEAFEMFEEMRRCNVMPDAMILTNIVSTCARNGNMNYNSVIYEFLKENSDVKIDAHLLTSLVTLYVGEGSMDIAMEFYKKMSVRSVYVSTAMVSGFAKIGKLDEARLVFDRMEYKDLVCWTTMITGYTDNDRPQEAITVFEDMNSFGIKPDEITMCSVISACAKLGTIDKAKWVHHRHVNLLESSLVINNALINMYAKCGGLMEARDVFESMAIRDVVSWSSMINAFATHGEGDDALMLFTRMREEEVKPNEVTFVGVLNGCSHSGLVEEGKKIFALMVDVYKIRPTLEHYGCMVDLFGRANRLREAVEIIETMPMAANVIIWGSLMSACKVHGELELGEYAARQILELERDHDGAFVSMSNRYAVEERWDDVRSIRCVMDQKNVYKEKGLSRINLNSKF